MTEKEYCEALVEKNEEIIKKNQQLLIYADAIGEVLLILNDNAESIPIDILKKLKQSLKPHIDAVNQMESAAKEDGYLHGSI